jgi:flagellar hook assembly protein FlgD
VSDLNNIEKLFQEQFENFEMPVRAELWSQVSAGAGVGKTVFWSTSKIIAAAFVGVLMISAVSWFVANKNFITTSHTNVELVNEHFVDENKTQSGSLPLETNQNTDLGFNLVDDVADEPITKSQPEKTLVSGSIAWLDFEPPKEDLIINEPTLYLVPDEFIEPEDGFVQSTESQYVTFEPAPTEKLNLEILIAPNKSEEKTLEQIHFPHAFVKIFNANLPGEAGQFSIQSKDLGSFEIEIRTRSGKLVYTSTDPNFIWRGEQMDGSEAPEGTYLYTIFSTTSNGESIKPQAGSVFLMRK